MIVLKYSVNHRWKRRKVKLVGGKDVTRADVCVQGADYQSRGAGEGGVGWC